MMPLSKAWLLLMGALSALVSGAIGLMIVASGGSPILVTPMLALLQGLLAVFLLWAGVHVKRFIAHKSTWVNSLNAMRIALGARASAIVASLLVGALLGILVTTLSRIGAPEMMRNALACAFGIAAGLLWCVIAVVVERWCIIDEDDHEDGVETQQPTVSPA